MSDSLKEALGVLDAYMAGLNRGDEAAVNAACNFPHVRLAGGKVVVWPNHGDYKLADFVARAGDGWARSQWDERTPIHVGSDKVHLKVAFNWDQRPLYNVIAKIPDLLMAAGVAGEEAACARFGRDTS